VRVRYWNAGHILGSASIEVEVNDGKGKPIRILFSGDLGPDHKVFYEAPDAPAGYDYILSESTYGGRDREDLTLVQRRDALKLEINEALARGGNLVIPTFAVERSQELLHDIGVLIRSGEISPSLVFLDSPLASKVTEVYRKYASMFEDSELSAEELVRDPRFRIIEAVEESKAINSIRGGAIIMSASGMADAGRIKHHLRNNLPRGNATVLFVGYQAPGTLGQIIQSGAKEVRIHSTLVPVRARIRSLGNYSAHADHTELVDWVTKRLPAHGAIFLTHGEDEERAALRTALMREDGLAGDQVIMPLLDDAFELRANGVGSVKPPSSRRVDLSQVASDWHNAYASFIIDLSHQLQSAPTDARRIELMQRLQGALASEGLVTPPLPLKTQPGATVLHGEPSGE
jgi:metallo-beta-lactamase family protein